jgi:sulfite reductase beta subunit-like hemoprotein
VGEGTARIGKRLGRFTEADAPAAVAGIARHYARERKAGEAFPAFVDRVGLPVLGEAAKAAVEAANAGDGGATAARAAATA